MTRGSETLRDQITHRILVLFHKAINVISDGTSVMDNYELGGTTGCWLLERALMCKLSMDGIKQVGIGATGLKHELLVEELED